MNLTTITWVAADPASLGVLDTARKLAGAATTLLITGESGTGKDQLARWIHDHGPRRARAISKDRLRQSSTLNSLSPSFSATSAARSLEPLGENPAGWKWLRAAPSCFDEVAAPRSRRLPEQSSCAGARRAYYLRATGRYRHASHGCADHGSDQHRSQKSGCRWPLSRRPFFSPQRSRDFRPLAPRTPSGYFRP